MARHGPIFDLCRSLANRDGIEDLALSRTPPSSGARVPKVVLTTELLEQATFKDAATLHEQTAVDRFGRHLHVRIARKGASEPARNLLRRPLLRELLGYRATQRRPAGQTTGLRTTAATPSLCVGHGRSIDPAPAVSRYFAADR